MRRQHKEDYNMAGILAIQEYASVSGLGHNILLLNIEVGIFQFIKKLK